MAHDRPERPKFSITNKLRAFPLACACAACEEQFGFLCHQNQSLNSKDIGHHIV